MLRSCRGWRTIVHPRRLEQSLHPTSPPRNQAIDILKGIAIILVVYGHLARGVIDQGSQHLQELLMHIDFLIYTTHMPVFFYIAGFHTLHSLTKDSDRAFVKSRLVNLVFPYFLWTLVIFCLKFAFSFVTQINHPLSVSELLEILWNPFSIFWFLYVLFVLQILTMLARTWGRTLLGVSVLLSLLVFLARGDVPHTEVWFMSILYAPFFWLGYVMAEEKKPLIPAAVVRWDIIIPAAIAFFALGECAVLLGVKMPVSFMMLPVSVLGIVVLAGLSGKISGGKIAGHMAYIGSASFAIYILHALTLALVPRILPKLGIHNEVLLIALGTFLGVYGSLILYRIMEIAGVERYFALPRRVGATPRRLN